MFFKGIFYLFPQSSTEEALALLETTQVADVDRDPYISLVKNSQVEDWKSKKLFGSFCRSIQDYDIDEILEFAYSTEDKSESLRCGNIAQFLKYRDCGLPCPESVLLILDEENGVVVAFDERGFHSSWWAGDFSPEYELFVVKEE